MKTVPRYRLEARGVAGDLAGQEFTDRKHALRNFTLFAGAFADILGPHDPDRLVLLGPDHKLPPPPPDPVGISDAAVDAIVREVAAELRAKAVLGA